MNDVIIFTEKSEALSFYLAALSKGIIARWNGLGYSRECGSSYVVKVDVEKTVELKNNQEGYKYED